jgi:hypothetical protein
MDSPQPEATSGLVMGLTPKWGHNGGPLCRLLAISKQSLLLVRRVSGGGGGSDKMTQFRCNLDVPAGGRGSGRGPGILVPVTGKCSDVGPVQISPTTWHWQWQDSVAAANTMCCTVRSTCTRKRLEVQCPFGRTILERSRVNHPSGQSTPNRAPKNLGPT